MDKALFADLIESMRYFVPSQDGGGEQDENSHVLIVASAGERGEEICPQ